VIIPVRDSSCIISRIRVTCKIFSTVICRAIYFEYCVTGRTVRHNICYDTFKLIHVCVTGSLVRCASWLQLQLAGIRPSGTFKSEFILKVKIFLNSLVNRKTQNNTTQKNAMHIHVTVVQDPRFLGRAVTNERTRWSRVLLEKLTVTQLVKKFLACMEPEGSLSCSQQPVNGSYPQLDASSPHLPTMFLSRLF
jgi:hypothetical protein